ncbi:MAG: hypothetical protein AAFV43_07985 [Planctomycetota bacterium]
MPLWLKQLGLTPAKAALIAVLGGVLLFVWGPQVAKLFVGRPGRAAAARLAPVTSPPATRSAPAEGGSLVSLTAVPRNAVASPNAGPSDPPARQSKPSGRPSLVDLEAALLHDPFKVPAWSPRLLEQTAEATANAESASDSEAAFAALEQLGVGMVLLGGDTPAATIGDQTVHVGDQIEGFRVMAITADGVTLSPAAEDDRGA